MGAQFRDAGGSWLTGVLMSSRWRLPKVTRVERCSKMLGGDLPSNPVFELDNRGKPAIALDLSDERGIALLHQLVAARMSFSAT